MAAQVDAEFTLSQEIFDIRSRKHISNVHLYLEQFLLRNNFEPTEQLLYKRNHIEMVEEPRELSGAEGIIRDQRTC